MKEHKTKENAFEWVPMHERKGRFGAPMPPRKPETRSPVLWLARDDDELYLVNNSKEPLEFVMADSGGFQTLDDNAAAVKSETAYEYKDVQPGHAVKIDEYDGFYDLDYVLQVYIKVQSPSLGTLQIASPPEKGGVRETVLLWDSGEPGKYVSIETLNHG